MKSHGLEIIRLFMVWDQLEPMKGEWRFEVYDACFDEAAKLGMGVVPTLMSVSPPGWMQLTDGPQSIANLDSPAYLEASCEYIAQVVTRYASHKSLHSWILWNEPTRFIDKNTDSIREYVNFLERRFGTIHEVNNLFYRTYSSFDELEQNLTYMEGHSNAFKGYAEALTWIEFSVDNLNRHLAIIRDEIRKWDAGPHPIHTNPHALQSELQGGGQSIWKQRQIVDFMGCSAHPVWHSTRFPESRYGQSVAFFSDLMKSATPDKDGRFWVTELQGGTTIFSSDKPFTPDGPTVKRWMWEGLASGAEAVVFWCFNARNDGFEAGEWSLLNQLGEPSDRIHAARGVAKTIERLSEQWNKIQPGAADVAILYSEQSSRLAGVEGETNEPTNPRNRNMHLDAIAGAYLMCSDLSLEVRFLNEDMLASDGVPDGCRLLIIPGAIVVTEKEWRRIEEFVKDGGLVIADGLTAMKDKFGKIDTAALGSCAALFDASVEDIFTTDDSLQFHMDSMKGEGWFYRIKLRYSQSAKVKARFDNGSAAVTESAFGKGTAIRVATNLFQRYFAFPESCNLEVFHQLLDGRITTPVTSNKSGKTLRLRRLTHPDGWVVVPLFDGVDCADITFHCAGDWINLSDGTVVPVYQGDTLTLKSSSPDGQEVYLFRTT